MNDQPYRFVVYSFEDVCIKAKVRAAEEAFGFRISGNELCIFE